VYVVEGGGGVHLVPAVKAVVKEIDVTARRMVVDWIDGM
jgi:ribosomal 30S subunit maturation factor RimM